MSTPNDDALRCAEMLEHRRILNIGEGDVCELSAAHIRRLVAENTTQRELLRQAVEAWDSPEANFDPVEPVIEVIREHLKEQP